MFVTLPIRVERFAVVRNQDYLILHRLADAKVRTLQQELLANWHSVQQAIDVDTLTDYLTKYQTANLDWQTLQSGFKNAIVSVGGPIAKSAALKSIPLLRQQMDVWRRAHGRVQTTEQFQDSTDAWLNMSFALKNQDAEQFLSNYLPHLITQETATTQAAVGQVVLQGFQHGDHPYDMAATIKSMVGLDAPRAAAYQNFLAASHTPDETSRYLNTLLTARANTIARTETLRAANAGQTATWNSAVDNGLLNKQSTVRQWIATPDDRECDECAPLDGVTVAMDGAFSNETFGTTEYPPLHPMCRCTTGLDFTDLPDEITPADAAPEEQPPPELQLDQVPEPEEIPPTPAENLPPAEPIGFPPPPPGPETLLNGIRDPSVLNRLPDISEGGLTPNEVTALKHYTGSGYSSVNRYLRGDKSIDASPLVSTMDSAFASPAAVLPDAWELSRGTTVEGYFNLFGDDAPTLLELAQRDSAAVVKFESEIVGKVIQDPGFISTSASDPLPRPVTYDIVAPAGTRALYLEPITLIRGEHEVLLNRGTKFVVTGWDSLGDDVLHIGLRVLVE